MARFVRLVLGTLIVLIILGGPYVYWRYQRIHQRNFQIVRDGVLYRSGQLSALGLESIVQTRGIQTVISLRYADDGEETPPDVDEELWCRKQGINYVRIRPRAWSAKRGPVPAETALLEFFEVMDDPDHYPVLIHCFAGAHRTGSFCAIYRMEYQGWSNAEAIEEMRTSGYDTIDEDLDVYEYLKNYRGRARLQRLVGQPAGDH